MKVYVLELGVYEDQSVEGVFSTLEKAQESGEGEWKQGLDIYTKEPIGWWSNDLGDWKYGVITEYEVQ